MKRISVAAPLLTGNEKKYVMDAVEKYMDFIKR